MKPLKTLCVLALDLGLMLLLYGGYHYNNPVLVTVAVVAMWVLIVGSYTVVLAYFLPAASSTEMVAKLKAMDAFWDALDKHSMLWSLYDHATDVAVVLLAWLAGAPITAIAYVPFMLFKAYNKTQGSRLRILTEAAKFSN